MSKAVIVSRHGLPPGPKGSLIGGNLGQVGPRRVDFFLDLARTYGPLASFRIGRWRLFLASDPDLIHQVLVTDAKCYIKHFGARTFKPVLGNGLVTSEGDFWLRQRRLLQPAFLKAQVQSYAPVMANLAEAMLAKWHTGKSVNLEFEFSSLTSAIALKTLFGLDDQGDRERIDESLRQVFDLLTARLDMPFQWPLWLPTPTNIRLNRALTDVRHVVDGFIAAGRARPRGSDLLSTMIAAQHDDGTGMSDQQLRDEAMTLYLAGHETTALTLTWSWYLLSQHPAIEKKLVEEWQRVLSGRAPTPSDLTALPYTAAVINEAMRLYPPVYVIGREATTDLELGGYRVKRGYTVLMSQWVNHRDPKYFAEPERFSPERWLNGLAARLPKFVYYPFGGGQRICIGSHFALMEAAIILSTVGQKYKFTLSPDAVIDIKPQITLPPKYGMPATLERR
ncbi:cytochrome P450 family protein [Hyphomicrobium denitrificans 1NES1]|uniref:Cytochrome P450 family protein n=1 Tax=Hyphomicrobium denitrificans 1NES1 TaxID=670307 RepID=N0B5W2_9HYPH|nr:cytochrome P450 [Hyphomicrobium denitrificans]AGK57627.1 cytochrome P450 family protein [Hyphomicrobium denitrificans 1NES1]